MVMFCPKGGGTGERGGRSELPHPPSPPPSEWGRGQLCRVFGRQCAMEGEGENWEIFGRLSASRDEDGFRAKGQELQEDVCQIGIFCT